MTAPDAGGRPLRILFAGGGTGGHLYPGIAIAEEIRRRRPESDIAFIGNGKTLEAWVVPERGFRFHPIQVAGFRRSLSMQTVIAAVKALGALVQSFLLMKRERPRVVVGTGGYVCGPPLLVASVLGIPTLIQEQNSYPGVTTRLLARRVTEVHVAFERARRFLPRGVKVVVSGNPTREVIGTVGRSEASARLGVEPGRFTLLVVGGSLGARSVNDAVIGVLPLCVELGLQLLWVTGPGEYDRVRRVVPEGDGARVFPYIAEMHQAYGASDLVLCRAGATTLAEVARAGLPSLLVPYPHAAADHQTENARAMVEAGASEMIADADLAHRLGDVLRGLAGDRARLQAMGSRARELAAPQAAKVLADAVIRLAGG